jgi:anti-sigma B factor antagonist
VEMAFEIVEDTTGELPVVAVRGEIDIVTAPKLQDALLSSFNASSPRGVVDLSEVTFLDSTGLSVLVTAQKQCRDFGGGLELVITSDAVLRVFEITGLAQHFDIVERRTQ